MKKVIKIIPLLVALYAPVQAEPLSPLRFHRHEQHRILEDVAQKHRPTGPLREGVLDRKDYIHCRFPRDEKAEHIHCRFPQEDTKYIHCRFPREERRGDHYCRFPNEE